MAVNIDQELRRREFALDHVALELGHVDPVGGEAAERLVKRRRHVADAEHEGRHHWSAVALRRLRVLRQDHEARRVVRFVLDVVGEDLQAVDVGGQRRRQRGARRIVPLGNLAGRACRVAGDDGFETELADDLAALAERVNVAVD